MKRATLIIFIAAILVISARGQGFLNLNFESAYNLPGNPPVPDGVNVPATNAIPDWTAYAGTSALSEINYVSNSLTGFATLVELAGGSAALSGDFSVGLIDGGSVSQTAMVPANAESLQFEATFGSPSLQVTLGGQSLSYTALSQGPGYSVYGANIPAGLAGQTETLTFGIQGLAESVLDNIEFSTTGVPEPAEWAMIGLGAFLFWVRRFRR